MDIIEDELKERLGVNLKFNELMKNHTTMAVGGIADYFIEVNTIEEMVNAIMVADKFSLPFLVIGAGSNVIVSDMGFKGLIIRNSTHGIIINSERGEVIADSGVNLATLLNSAASHNMGGIEFLAGIPGTLGGAVYGNAGSSTAYIGDYIRSVTILDKIRGELKVVKKSYEWMEFTYRNSKLKRIPIDAYHPVILIVQMRLTQRRNDEILKSIKENLSLRKAKQPYGDKSAGSFFKNLGKSPEQAAGYLLDKSGAKKLRVGGATVSKKHANFIINSRNASAKDIRKLADNAKQLVRDNYDIALEEEVEYIGEW